MLKSAEDEALGRLRRFMAEADLPIDSRMPPERELAGMIGVSRAQLRSALAALESEGQIWRHVGKGTFVGNRPIETSLDVDALSRRTSPAEVMRTRLLLEPEVASLAALSATPAEVAEMHLCCKRSRAAESWRQYESWDHRLHRVIATATHNVLLLALFDTLGAVRRAVTWGRARDNRERPTPDHHSFAEHDEIVDAIADRDPGRAHDLMRQHVESVERKLLRVRGR